VRVVNSQPFFLLSFILDKSGCPSWTEALGYEVDAAPVINDGTNKFITANEGQALAPA
jgi:hypothetical protein